jgi:Carboxypeptidase regulatory-like domain
MSTPNYIRRTGIILTLLLIWLPAFGQTQQQPEPDEGAEIGNTGTISGKVVNESGQPLPEALVVVRPFVSGNQGRATTTDREGAFRLSGLERFAYSISASAPAYTAPARAPDSTQPTHYRVGDAVRLVLVKGGVITGTVRSPEGEPVVGVQVLAQMIRDENGQPSRYGASLGRRLTDDRGIYRIYGLPTGTYLVVAGGSGSSWGARLNPYVNDAPTYAPASSRDTAAEINVRSGEEASNVDIRYRGEPGHMVSGIATGPQPAEPAGFRITLSSVLDGGSQWSTSTFQPSGGSGFAFYGVADGDYDITAQSYFPNGENNVSEPRRIRVRGADVSGVEVTAKPLGSISGTVVAEDSKAPECKGKRRPLFTETVVSAWHNEKTKKKDQPQFLWSLGGPSAPDKEGSFVLRNLAPGQYYFIARFSAKYWYLRSISLPPAPASGSSAAGPKRSVDAARNWTTVKSSDRLSGLVVTLAEGAASLRGKVTIEDGKEFPARLYVYLVPAEHEKADDVLRFFATPVAADGGFALNNLAPGRYWMVAQPALEAGTSPLTKLRLPDEEETRATLRRDAEAAKTPIELKPCHNVEDYRLALKSLLISSPKN